MPQSTANYGRINPDGSVSGTFPGGIEIPTTDQQVGIAPIRPGVGVVWKKSSGGVLAEITALAFHKPGAGTPRTAEWELSVTTDPADLAAPGGSAGLFITAANGSLQGAEVMVNANKDVTIPDGGQTVSLLDDQGRSQFVQLFDSGARVVLEYALVASNGTLAFGSPGVLSTSLFSNPGQYAVTFREAALTRVAVASQVLGFSCTGVAWNNRDSFTTQFFPFTTSGASINSEFQAVFISLYPPA